MVRFLLVAALSLVSVAEVSACHRGRVRSQGTVQVVRPQVQPQQYFPTTRPVTVIQAGCSGGSCGVVPTGGFGLPAVGGCAGGRCPLPVK